MTENRDIGFLIQLIGNKIKKAANQELEANGITIKQGRFLGYLHERKGLVTTQKDFQEHFDITHPTTAGIIKRLEQKELISTRADESDRRTKIVELAPKEKKIHSAMVTLKDEIETQLMNGFSEEDQQQLTALLMRVYDNIKE